MLRMVPGPTAMSPAVAEAHARGWGSADLEEDFLPLHDETISMLRELCGTSEGDVVAMTGEGMCALWGAMKSVVAPGARVLCLSTGCFGSGMADIARACGAADVRTVSFAANDTLRDWASVDEAVAAFRPSLVTAVHCETPSGTLNELSPLRDILSRHGQPLLYVDAVSSVGGAEVCMDAWGADLLCGGAQKCLGCPPSMCFVGVSQRAWAAAERVQYRGYDALLPWRGRPALGCAPYTPCWHGIAALHASCSEILREGLSRVFARHTRAAERCRERLGEIPQLRPFYAQGATPSPTVTAAALPPGTDWHTLDRRLRASGLLLGGSYGELAGKVLRVGHMGTVQASVSLVDRACDILKDVLQQQ